MPISNYFSRYFYGVTRDVNNAQVRCKWAVFDFFPMMLFGPCPTPPATRSWHLEDLARDGTYNTSRWLVGSQFNLLKGHLFFTDFLFFFIFRLLGFGAILCHSVLWGRPKDIPVRTFGHTVKYGMAWSGKTWSGVIKHGMIKHGVIKRGADKTWSKKTWSDKTWSDDQVRKGFFC